MPRPITSPNQQLIASLDLARRQMDLEGFGMVRQAYRMALTFREHLSQDPLLSRWFSVLDVADLIPAAYRPSGITSSLAADDAHSWADDEFVLDPTRVTLHVGKTGMNGAEFREKILMDRFGIQINKTSVNTVLLIFTIGVTWSSVQYLLDALHRSPSSNHISTLGEHFAPEVEEDRDVGSCRRRLCRDDHGRWSGHQLFT